MALGEVIGKKEHGEVKFTNRVRPGKGIASVVLAILAICLMSAMIVWSTVLDGNGEILLGAGGMVALLLTIIGFILSIRCFRMENIYYGTPICGLALNSVFLLAFLTLYAFGF